MEKKTKIILAVIIVGIIVISLGFLVLWNLIDTGKLEITVNDYGRNEDGSFYVIATVSNSMDEKVSGKFDVQVYNLSSHKSYSGYFRNEIFNMQYNTSITIIGGSSVTKNVTFGIPLDETPIAIRFSRWDNRNYIDIQKVECTVEIPH